MQDGISLTPPTDNWLMHPGAKIQPVCGYTSDALHFSGTMMQFYCQILFFKNNLR